MKTLLCFRNLHASYITMIFCLKNLFSQIQNLQGNGNLSSKNNFLTHLLLLLLLLLLKNK